MARLPSERYLIQQIGGEVILFEDYTEREVVRFDPSDGRAVEAALEVVRDSELGPEDRSFACFWAGYFHAHSNRDPEVARELFVTEAERAVVVTVGGTEVVRFDPADANAAARAQKVIFDSALTLDEQLRAHFWSGYFYAHAGLDSSQE